MAPKSDPQEALLPLAKLKPLVRLAETSPVSVAFGLTKERTALLLPNKTAKPKKAAKQLKDDAKASLDPNSLRFGRITIDANDPTTVRFSVNKTEASGTVSALVRLIKQTGYQSVVINLDPMLESESEEETDTAAPVSQRTAEQPVTEAPAPPPPPPPPPLDAAALTRTLAGLIQRIPAVSNGDATVQQKLTELAMAARNSLKTPDLPAAAQGIDALNNALNAVVTPPAPPSLGAAGSNGAAVALTKSVLLWDSTRKYLEGQIKPLRQAILEASSEEEDFAAIEAGTPVLEQVMERLDTRLSAKLNQIHGTPDQAIRVQLRKEAKDIVTEYEAYMASEPLVGALDGNPFISFDGVARVQATLKAIATYL